MRFANSDWYIIKDSSIHDDYVTLLKEKLLTRDELDEDYQQNYYCNNINSDRGGPCSSIGQIIEGNNGVYYYWSDSCHLGESGYPYIYGKTEYTNSVFSGCEDNNNYNGSKIQEFLDGIYLRIIGSDNLKQVDGYKIRLLNRDDLIDTFHYLDHDNGMLDKTDETPEWIYQNFDNKLLYYWTMVPNKYVNSGVVTISNGSSWYGVYEFNIGIRPVINVYKSAIQN